MTPKLAHNKSAAFFKYVSINIADYLLTRNAVNITNIKNAYNIIIRNIRKAL